MTAPTDAERAREIVRGVRFDCPAACNGDDDERCAYCGDDHRGPLIGSISAALAAVRTDERERAARIAETHIGSFARNPDYVAQKIAAAIRAVSQ